MKHFLQSSALAVALAMSTNNVSAHSEDITCDADFAYNIAIQKDGLSFSSQDQQKVLITSSQELFLDGNKQNLNAKQQALLQEYNKQVRELLPLASDLAEEASAIAIDAVASVTSALMQDKPQKAEEFMTKVEAISAGLKQHISDSHLRPDGIAEYIESSDFETEFEALVGEAVKGFLEDNLGEMIAASMSGNEEQVKAFEQRMEKFGQDMEQKFEARAEALEKQAEELCQLVESIDRKEDEFVEAFAKFDDFQLIVE